MSIQIEELSFAYLNSPRQALSDVTLTCPEGQVTAIVGPTGAGKSTLLLTLNGLVPKEIPGRLEGSISIDGVNIRDVPTTQLARNVVLMFEDPALQIVSLTVEEDIAFGPGNLGLPPEEIRKRVKEALARMRLKGYERRNPRFLSGGEQQLLALAGIIAMQPKYIGMDEPVAMLDPIGKAQVFRAVKELKEEGVSVIITDSGTDIQDLCAVADQLVLLHKGRILATGTPGEIFKRRDLIEEVGLRIPQVTRVSWLLESDYNMKPAEDTVPTTIDECLAFVKNSLSHVKQDNNQHVDVIGSCDNSVKENGKSKSVEGDAEGDAAVIVRNLWHVFPGPPPVEALRGIDLKVNRGEMLALIGQNGSGKTTLAYHLVGIHKPTNPDAQVIVDGVDVVHAPLTETIRHVNYVFQNPSNQLFCDTFGAEVGYGPSRLGFDAHEIEKRVNFALEQVGLGAYGEYSTFGMTRSIQGLLALASIISMEPNVLIVDEPTGGLDYKASLRVLDVLRKLNETGVTVIIVTHDMELVANYCHRVVVLKKGQLLLDGSPREVFSMPEVLEEAMVYPPQPTRLAQELGHPLIPDHVLTVEELADAIGCLARR